MGSFERPISGVILILLILGIFAPVLKGTSTTNDFEAMTNEKSAPGARVSDATLKDPTVLGVRVHDTIGNQAEQLVSEFASRQLLVKLKVGDGSLLPDVRSISELNKQFAVSEIERVASNVFELTFEKDVDVISVAKEYSTDPNIEYAGPNHIFHTCVVPNDANYNLQWAHKVIESERAWDTETGDSNVVIGVIDTGVDWTHVDLAPNIWNNTRESIDGLDNDNNGYIDDLRGWDFFDRDNDPMDISGHGTHCSGIAAAVGDNTVGVAGLTWSCKIMPLRVGTTYEGWKTSDLIQALKYAVDNGARIISMSWGLDVDDPLLHEAIKYAYAKGTLLVAAAGNEATSSKLYPAAYEEVVAVAATGSDDKPTYWTNFGEWIEVAAPGDQIFSTVPDDSYSYMSGTSMSTPLVAGEAALILSRFPTMSRDWIRVQLRQSADDLGDLGFDIHYGYGRINARKGVELTTAHDLLILDLHRPLYVNPGTASFVNATVFNFGTSDESSISVELMTNRSVVNSAIIRNLSHGAAANVTFLWRPTVAGNWNVTCRVVPVYGEADITNNAMSGYTYVGFPTKAFVLDSAGTELVQTWDELNTKWYLFGQKMIFIDYSTLRKDNITYEDLKAAGADLLIISCAYSSSDGWEFTDSEIEGIARYVYEGHGLVATAGTFYSDVPNNNKLASLFGLSESTQWTSTETDLLELLDPSHPIFSKVPSPYSFHKVVTSVPREGIWDSTELAGATYVALGHSRESAITVARGLVYISPWLEIMPPHYRFHLQLLYNAMAWTRYQKPQHEISVSLFCTSSFPPGETSLINGTVHNLGLTSETRIRFQLAINGSVVNSTTIPELPASSSFSISYLWKPTIEGRYNVSAYATPVSGEDFTDNNYVGNMVRVRQTPTVALISDQSQLKNVTGILDSMEITYDIYNQNTENFYTASLESMLPYKVVVFNKHNRLITASEHSALQSYLSSGGNLLVTGVDSLGYPEDAGLADVVRSSSIGDNTGETDLYVVRADHPIVNGVYGSFSEMYHVTQLASDCDRAEADTTRGAVTVAELADDYDKIIATEGLPGKVVYWNGEGGSDWTANVDCEAMFKNTLYWFISEGLEHDLAVALDAPSTILPGASIILNATVKNDGRADETNIKLFLLINGSSVNSSSVNLPAGNSCTASYSWTPSIEATYNITAYATPLPTENFTRNNFASRMVRVRQTPNVALISDQSQLEDVAEILDSTAITYDTYERNAMYLYTANLALLLTYRTVVFNKENRLISLDEKSALQSYISSGGNLLVTGYDSLGDPNDSFLADTVCSSSTGDNTEEPDLYVVDEQHPIMNGPFGRFPQNYHISGLRSDCDRAEADTTRGAVTVAELADDYDKIIATEGLPGKVVYWNGEGGSDWTANVDCEAMFKNTLYWFAPREHDLAVALEAPDALLPGESTVLNATVSNQGSNNETDVKISILVNDSIANVATIPELKVGFHYTVTYLWEPAAEGLYNVTAYAQPIVGEDSTTNNIKTKVVRVTSLPTDRSIVTTDPRRIPVRLGQVFTANIEIINIPELYSWQFQMYYRNDILEGMEVLEGPFLRACGNTLWIPYAETSPLGIEQNYNATHGRICVGCTLLGDVSGANGTGVIATVTFNCTGLGNVELQFFDVILIGPAAEYGIPIPPDEYVVINGLVLAGTWAPASADLNQDGAVDIVDIAIAGRSWGSYPGHPRWNPVADLDGNNIVNVLDITLIAKAFGRTLT